MDYDRELIPYSELTEEWQEEARSNSDYYEDFLYIAPLDTHTPLNHCLLDLSECMRTTAGSKFDGVIGVSNNIAIGVNISPCGELCKLTYLG